MVWYADGSIQVEANGQVATGTGTAFLKNVRIGDGLTIAGSASMHEVTNIASDTQLTFSPPFTGAAGAGKQYRIAPIQGYVKEAADRLREVLREVGPLIMSEALQALAEAQTDQERRAAVGLGKVDNTADADKPISKATAGALADPGQKNPDLVTQAEAEAGTGTGIRSWPVVRVWQSIAAWVAANLGTAARKNVTSSSIDKTADRVLRTGDGGWMGDVPTGGVAQNIDDRTMRGWRYIGSDSSGTKPTGVVYGHVLTFGNTGDAVTQEFWELDGNPGRTLRKFMRNTFGTGPWGPWVSLTGETGGNANGTYWKLPNGLLICRYNATLEAGGALKNLDWTFPAQFAGKPYVDVQSEQGQGSDPSLFSRTLTYQYLSGSMARIQYKSPSQVTGVLIAIGVAA